MIDVRARQAQKLVAVVTLANGKKVNMVTDPEWDDKADATEYRARCQDPENTDAVECNECTGDIYFPVMVERKNPETGEWERKEAYQVGVENIRTAESEDDELWHYPEANEDMCDWDSYSDIWYVDWNGNRFNVTNIVWN